MGLLTAACLAAAQATSPAPVVPAELGTSAWTTVGARIPSLELPRIDGRGTVNLADLRGRKLLLIQFAAW